MCQDRSPYVRRTPQRDPVAGGKTASFRDTDAVMFPNGYEINGHNIPGGKWIKIQVGVVCINPLNTKVRCFGL